MKKRLLSLPILLIIILFFSCQKELSVETGGKVSEGSLQAGSGGDCLPKTIAGIYEAGAALNATTHYIDVEVNVTQTGAYVIYTDTVNGIFFRATGIFTSTGLVSVRLKGSGTPVGAGISNFVVTYGGSSCSVSIMVLPAGGATPAVFTLSGAPNPCTTPSISGNYVVAVALTPSNTVVLNVNVTTAGTYNITTPPSNGMTFSGSGFLATGAQTITLTGSGTPVVAGDANFPVTAGSSTCSFTITTTAVPIVMDYFPRTALSNWSYEVDGVFDDSALIRAIAPTVTIGGNVFNVFEGTLDAANGFDSAGYYRKNGGSYSRFEKLDDYLGLDDPQRAEFIFLKDDQAAGHTWTTAAYNGTIGGVPLSIRIKFTILQKDVSVTVKGVSYPNTIVVEEKYEINVGAGFTDATSVFGYYKDYYSRDIGWILDEYFDQGGTLTTRFELRRHQVVP